MVVLILLAAGVAMVAKTETHISRNYADVNRCLWAAHAGVQGAIGKVTTLAASQPVYLGEEQYTVTSDDLGLDMNGYSFSVVVEDEAGKININTASEDSLTQLFGSNDIADAIIGWRTPSGTSATVETNDEYYSSQNPPYKCKGAAFETVAELGLVKGVTSDLLSSAGSSSTDVSLEDLLTVYAPLKAVSTDSGSKVDIQSASQDSLRSSLGSILSAQDISSIISYRRRHAFRSPAEIVRVGISRSKIEQIYDKLTVARAATHTGLVNINSASSDVLAVLPGMDAVTAKAVVDYRASKGAFSGVGYLLEVTGLSDSAFVSVAPYLTVNSNVFRIKSVGQYSPTGATATVTCVVEIDSGEAKIRYWQE